MAMLTLLKYHGLGNDFLIALDGAALEQAAVAVSSKDSDSDPVAGIARALCDRHRGVGADGLIVVRPSSRPGAAVAMELRNADGGRAETSGNGLRCLALAVVDAGKTPGPEVSIETDAGLRQADVRERLAPGSADVSVAMGTVAVVHCDPVADPALPGSRALPWPAWSVEVGNPHLVLLAPSLQGIALSAIGPELEDRRPGGQNVEFTTYDASRSELTLLVWERGAGATLACGSGSVAAAAALHAARISPREVRVHNPGGSAEVRLSGDDPFAPEAELAGLVHRVATIELDPREIAFSATKVMAR